MNDVLDVQRYCNLAQQKDFQDWLKSISDNLYSELMSHLGKSEGCSSNKNKMKMIYAKLNSMDKIPELLKFAKEKYPHLIIRNESNSLKRNNDVKVEISVPDLNYHKVFPNYSEKFLLFPHRKIFVGQSYVIVNNLIINFIQHFLGTDYLILEHDGIYYGYVEYFQKKYEKIISQVPMEKRHIHIYKLKNGLTK